MYGANNIISFLRQPPILQCSSSTLRSTDHPSGKLTACQPTEVLNEPTEQIEQYLSYYHSEDSGVGTITPANELSDLLSTQLKINDGEDNPTHNKEHNKSHTQLDENKNVRSHAADIVPQSLLTQRKDVKSKTLVNALLPGQISSLKTLQRPKPKLQNALAQRGNASASPNSNSTLTDCKILTNASSSPQQENFHTKKKRTIPNSYTVHHTTVNDSPDSNISKLINRSSPAGHSLLTEDMQDPKPIIHNTWQLTDKSSEGELPAHLRAGAAEPSSKVLPKGSLLRLPTNLPSKLKTPNISKPGILSQDVPKEPQKPPGKLSSSVIPRPLSHKGGVREAVNCSIPKRQSRVPQPKSH